MLFTFIVGAYHAVTREAVQVPLSAQAEPVFGPLQVTHFVDDSETGQVFWGVRGERDAWSVRRKRGRERDEREVG